MILGITGHIASGKSSVAQMFARLGVPVVSADQISRAVVAPGSQGLAALVSSFGAGILDAEGCLDRGSLGRMVFADPCQRRRLETILHPLIAEHARGRLEELHEAGKPLIVYEAPLLFEAGAEERVDRVLTVLVDADRQISRLCARDGIDEAAARRRLVAQFAQGVKAARSDYLIDNSGTLAETEAAVGRLYRQLWEQEATN